MPRPYPRSSTSVIWDLSLGLIHAFIFPFIHSHLITFVSILKEASPGDASVQPTSRATALKNTALFIIRWLNDCAVLPYHLKSLFYFVYRALLEVPSVPRSSCKGSLQDHWCSWEMSELGSGQDFLPCPAWLTAPEPAVWGLLDSGSMVGKGPNSRVFSGGASQFSRGEGWP